MRKKCLEKRLGTVVEFYHPLDHPEAPLCLRKMAASLNGQRVPLQDALDAVKGQLSQVPVGETVDVDYYMELKGRLFHRWTEGGWIVVIVKEEGRRKRGWKVIKFRRPK